MKKILNIVFGLIIILHFSCSKTYEFRAPVDPEAANLSKPANNSQCLEVDSVNFEWNKSENTDSYTITIINLDTNETTNKNSNTNSVCLVGKSWDFHVDVALGITNEENLKNISESAKHFVKAKKEFMFDAEHFFDGYKANPKYALSCIKAAYDQGARWIVLCDTNGGTLPHEVLQIVKEVSKVVPGKNLGIHAHNDTGNAVANSLAAVLSGVRQIQGTINGLGERCGNANLMSLIPTFFFEKRFFIAI